jgi:hypothetical protein
MSAFESADTPSREEASRLLRSSSGRAPERLLALLVGLSLLWVSAILPLQHRDCFHHDTEAALATLQPAADAADRLPLHTHLAHRDGLTHARVCPACHWQAVQLSEPLPPQTLPQLLPLPTWRISARQDIFPSLPVHFAPSRAPPVA